jgi:hypothetical protein
MRTTRLYLTMSVVAGVVAAVAWAVHTDVGNASAQEVVPHTPTVTPEQSVPSGSEHKAKHSALKASEVIGMNVRGESGDDDIGSIDDLMIHRDGRVSYAAVSFGGFLGVGDKMFAVPWEAIEFVTTDDGDDYARINVTEERLKQMEGFDQENWPETPNKAFLGGEALRQAERPVGGTATGTEAARNRDIER